MGTRPYYMADAQNQSCTWEQGVAFVILNASLKNFISGLSLCNLSGTTFNIQINASLLAWPAVC